MLPGAEMFMLPRDFPQDEAEDDHGPPDLPDEADIKHDGGCPCPGGSSGSTE